MHFGQRWVRIALCASILAGGGLPSVAAPGRALLQRSEPVYEGLAREMRLRGDVVLFLLVEPDGAVQTVAIESGHPILAASAMTAVRRWKYAPAPTRTSELVKFTF